MILIHGQPQKVVAVAGNQHKPMVDRVTEYFPVARGRSQHVLHVMDVIPCSLEYASYICWNVVIQKKRHSSAPAICCAINRSIASLWSS